MEKAVFLLVGPPAPAGAALGDSLRGEVLASLRSMGATRTQVNLTDASLGHPFGVDPDPDSETVRALVSTWVDAIEGSKVASALPIIDGDASWQGFLVTESEPVPNRLHPPGPDGRVPGFAQIVALSKPDHLGWAAWRRTWQGGHTSVAINTQSTFRYVQNVITRPLTAGAHRYAAIVEECFPIEAATDLHVFFDSGGDDAKLSRHMAAMSESCDKFMDGTAPVAWTTEYLYD